MVIVGQEELEIKWITIRHLALGARKSNRQSGLHACDQCSCSGPVLSSIPCQGFMLCGRSLEILTRFIFEFVFCKRVQCSARVCTWGSEPWSLRALAQVWSPHLYLPTSLVLFFSLLVPASWFSVFWLAHAPLTKTITLLVTVTLVGDMYILILP